MTRHSFAILVVDDRLDEKDTDTECTRRASYQMLSDAFDVSFAESASHFDQIISERRFDAFLIDFVLADWGTDARLILARLKGRYPVGLISSFWPENFEKLREVIDQHSEVKALFCWDDLRLKERRGLITFWLTKAIREHKALSSLTLGDSDPIRILHFSDLQFGGGEPNNFESETHVMAETIRDHWQGKGPTFALITGDIAESGLPSHYERAQSWLLSFMNSVSSGSMKDRIMVIPGNHDICQPLASAVSAASAPSGLGSERNDELSKFGFTPFRHFAASLTGDPDWHNPDKSYWVSGKFRHLGVIFFGYNTAEMLDESGHTTRVLRDSRLAEMFREIRRLKVDASAECIVIGLIHHPLVPLQPHDSIAQPMAFYRNMMVGDLTWVILTGHVHGGSASPQDQSGAQFLEIISPTPTKEEAARQTDTLRGFNIIDIERENGIPVRLKVTTCEFSGFILTPRPANTFERGGARGPFRRLVL